MFKEHSVFCEDEVASSVNWQYILIDVAGWAQATAGYQHTLILNDLTYRGSNPDRREPVNSTNTVFTKTGLVTYCRPPN